MLHKTWETGQVTRYHANPRLSKTNQTIADHSWGVAMILLLLCPTIPKNLLVAALVHDCGERFAGDLPSSFKRQFPGLAEQHAELEKSLCYENGVPFILELDEISTAWLHFADRLESFIFMREHGQLWDEERVDELMTRARELGVETATQQLIGGQ